jgi:hypothetical protein
MLPLCKGKTATMALTPQTASGLGEDLRPLNSVFQRKASPMASQAKVRAAVRSDRCLNFGLGATTHALAVGSSAVGCVVRVRPSSVSAGTGSSPRTPRPANR